MAYKHCLTCGLTHHEPDQNDPDSEEQRRDFCIAALAGELDELKQRVQELAENLANHGHDSFRTY